MNLMTMITVTGVSGSKPIGYTLMTQDYQVVTMSEQELENAIKTKSVTVTNVGVENGKLVATNGAFDKYTLINAATGMVQGPAKAVILNRVEKEDKLVGYTVFTQNGKIAEMSVSDAAALANKKMISNGKIRHTNDGDIVSAIGGTYPLRKLKIEQAPDGEVTIKIGYFGTSVGVDMDYFSAIISSTSAAQLCRLDELLNKSNAKVVSGTAKVAGQAIRDKIGLKRIGTSSIAGSFELDVLDKLLKIKNVKIEALMDDIHISAFKYEEDNTTVESSVIVGKDWKIKDKVAGSKNTVEKVKKYAESIKGRFGSVSIA